MASPKVQPRRILVTGDTGPDYDIYLAAEGDNPPPGSPAPIWNRTAGGAALAYRLLVEMNSVELTDPRLKAPLEIAIKAVETPKSPTIAIWRPHSCGAAFGSSMKNGKVWRIQRSLNLRDFDPDQVLPPAKPPVKYPNGFDPAVVLVEDNAIAYRYSLNHSSLEKTPWPGQNSWIIWKMSAPICHGELWWHAAETAADRMILVVSAAYLRQESVRVSKGISWERTALDLVNELSHSSGLAQLRKAKHVIVTLHHEGALWMRRLDSGGHAFTLFFDPGHLEEEWWAKMAADGEAYGYLTAFASALAACVAARGDAESGLPAGIDRGLKAMRALKAYGHGPFVKGNSKPEFPNSMLATILRQGTLDGKGKKNQSHSPEFDMKQLGSFGRVAIPDEYVHPADPAWRIVETINGRPAGEPLYGLARRVALFGESALGNVPFSRFGDLLTSDRHEIEALCNFKTLIESYKNSNEKKPLSLAVFGPPGAGKSFGVEQITAEVLGEKYDKRDKLVFNLSQFTANELTGAFHQVRDKVLEGQLPLVFWDEFDAGNYRWLQYLLAPMQDGKFQAGELTHPIGRCIFVFAGGTSCDMEHFGPPEPTHNATEAERNAWSQFKLLKGPDFKSRIHGSLDVLGPNRRLLFEPGPRPGTGQWIEDREDICFPLRRALLLRSQFRLKADQRLNMDYGLLNALLEVSCYTNGARSFVNVCQALKSEGSCYGRSLLPPDEVLAMNLGRPEDPSSGLAEFKDILNRDREYQANAPKLAKAFHDVWRQGKQEKFRQQGKPLKFKYNCEFDQLPPGKKADNISAASRMQRNLELAGFYLVPLAKAGAKKVKEFSHEMVEIMSQEEHFQWVVEMKANGWRQKRDGEKRNDDERIHDCILIWEELPETQREYDRWFIRNYPVFAKEAGFAVVAQKPRA